MEELLKKLTEIEESTKCNKDKQDSAYIRLQCVQILQQISEKLLTEYYIQVGSLRIDPLRVEAYYFHEGTFEDCATYKRNEQKKFNRLYLHGTDVGREGVDICIGSGSEEKNGDRYLSFLIKDAIVTDEDDKSVYCKQTVLYYKLKKVNEIKKTQKKVLQVKPKVKTDVFYTVRNGLSDKPFGQEPLGTLIPVKEIQIKKEYIVEEDENKEYLIDTKDIILKGISFYDFEKGFGKQWMLAKYALEKSHLNIEKAREIIKQEGLYQYKIEDQYIENALNYIKNHEK